MRRLLVEENKILIRIGKRLNHVREIHLTLGGNVQKVRVNYVGSGHEDFRLRRHSSMPKSYSMQRCYCWGELALVHKLLRLGTQDVP